MPHKAPQIWSFIASVSVLMLTAASAFGDELRIARYDGKQVFDQYLPTKKLNDEISARRHQMGPGSATPEKEQWFKLEKRLSELSEKVKQTAEGTPERERLEQEERVAALELQVAQLKRASADWQRGEEAADQVRRHRAKVIDEITAEAKLLATERGYALIVADNPGGLPSIVANVKSDDVTDELLARLNKKFESEAKAVAVEPPKVCLCQSIGSGLLARLNVCGIMRLRRN